MYVCMYVWMDGWMDGCMAVWMHGFMDTDMDVDMDGWILEWRVDAWVDAWMDAWRDEGMDEPAERRVGGRTDGWFRIIFCILSTINSAESHFYLTHWGRVTHICVGKLISIGSENGLSPGRRQAIIWTNARILLLGPLATNFSEILIEIHSFSFKKMHLKMSSAKGRLFSLGLNELNILSHETAPCHRRLPNEGITGAQNVSI